MHDRADKSWSTRVFSARFYVPVALVLLIVHSTMLPLPWLFESSSQQNLFGMLLAIVILVDGALAAYGGDRHSLKGYTTVQRFKRIAEYAGCGRLQSIGARTILLGMSAGILMWASHVMLISYHTGVAIEFVAIGTFIMLLFAPVHTLMQWILGPILEEALFRGILIRRLLELYGDTVLARLLSMIISAVLFAVVHTHNPSHKLIPGLLLGAFVLASRRQERDLRPAIVAHATVNLLFSIGRVPL